MNPAPSLPVDIRSISPRASLSVAAIVFGVLIALRVLWIAHTIFIAAFFGMLFGLAVARAVDWLERIRIPRGAGAPLVLVISIGLIVAAVAAMAPSLRTQGGELSNQIPRVLDDLERRIGGTRAKALLQQPQRQPQKPQPGQSPATSQPSREPQEKSNAPQPPQQGGLSQTVRNEVRGLTKFLFPVISSTLGALAGLVIAIFIAMYVAINPSLYREGILHLVPHASRERARELLSTLAVTLRRWLLARLIAMVTIGTITGLGLAALGIPGAAALGLLAGVLEFIPFFGPFMAAVPSIGIALVDSPQKAMAVALLYLVIQQLEGNVITPLLLERRLDIAPVLTVVTVAVFGVALGVLGMMIAEPILATALVITKMLYVQDVVGDDVKVGKEE